MWHAIPNTCPHSHIKVVTIKWASTWLRHSLLLFISVLIKVYFFKEKFKVDRLSTENLNRFGNGLFISTFHSSIRLSTLFNMSCKIQKLMACEKVLIITLCATITAILIDPIASFYIILIKKKYILKYFILSRILNQIIAYLWWCFGVV